MQDYYHPPQQPRRASKVVRIILWVLWSGMVFVPVSFTGTIALVLRAPMTGPAPDPQAMAIIALVGVVGATLSIGTFHTLRYFWFRSVMRKKSWAGMTVAYPIAKIMTWSACEGAVFFNLVVCLIAQSFWPGLLTAGAAWLVLAMDPPLMRPFRRLEDALARDAAGAA